eukprot:3314402-Ditylum_brightwellii.AAC.1
MTWTELDPEKEGANNNADFLVGTVHTMLDEFWAGSLDFESWASGTLSPVPKKGDLSDPNKWQP